MIQNLTVVGLGEALFDIFADKQVLGGAPLNVAVHAHQMLSPLGGRGVVVSRVGQDDLGEQIRVDLTQRGMSCDFIQMDPDRDTGRVYVGLDDRGEPNFEIVKDVAWDVLQFDPDLEDLARRCDAVCFGTLAQRDGQTRNTIYRFLDTARRAVRLFDVNLRQNYFDARIVQRSCELATVVKLNVDELPVVASLLGLPRGEKAETAGDVASQALLKKFGLKMVVLTRGERGTVAFTPAGRFEGAKASYPPATGADAVGAGDACSAGILVGMLRRWPAQQTVDLANRLGAYVASQPGATPTLPGELVKG